MSELNLREGEIKTFKESLTEKDSQITSLNKIVANKNTLISKVEADKEVRAKWSKANIKLIEKPPLYGAKHIIWDQLLAVITKFREYLNLIEDEHALPFQVIEDAGI